MLRHPLRILVALAVVSCLGVPIARADGCPKAVVFETDEDLSRIDVGWTGIFFGVPVSGWSLRLALGPCAGTVAGSCGECPITGLLASAGGRNQRCTNDRSVRCTDDSDCLALPGTCSPTYLFSAGTVPCTSDADCPSYAPCNRQCVYFAAPPNPLDRGGLSTCSVTEVPAAVNGTVDVETGAVSFTTALRTQGFIGDGVAQPCPVCEGDPTANDDQLGGTCNGGARAGLPCDANATFAGELGSTSLDCPPSSQKFAYDIMSTPARFGTDTTTAVISADSPNCSGVPGTGKRCFCETCNSYPPTPCFNNADCPPNGGSPGVCGGKRCVGGGNNGARCQAHSECPSGFCLRPGQAPRPSHCVDDTATPEDETAHCFASDPPTGDVGECSLGPILTQCAAPEEYRGCSSNDDCSLTGTCEATPFPCYMDNGVVGGSVSAVGAASPPIANVADPVSVSALFCVPPTGNGPYDNVAGLPGLGRLTLHGRLTFADEVVIENAAANTTVSTDAGENDGATPNDETETAVVSTGAGEVKIIENAPGGSVPSGAQLIGDQVEVAAPGGTAANPLTLTFNVDGSAAAGRAPDDVDLRRNGVVVPPCIDVPPLPISPDPCVFSRTMDGDDIRIRSYSSGGSTWDVVAYGIAVATATPTATPESSATPADTGTVAPTPSSEPTATASISPIVDPTPPPLATVTPTATATAVPLCPPQPAACRTPAVAGKAQLSLVDKTKDKDDQVQWKWNKGALTTKAEFGDPPAADGYALCLYDGSGLRMTLGAPAGGTCKKKPCWTAKKTGFVYADGDRTPDGVAQIVLKEGRKEGKAQIIVKAKGVDVPMPSLATLASPVTVQLRRSGGGPCWGAVYSFPPAHRQDATTFKDTAD